MYSQNYILYINFCSNSLLFRSYLLNIFLAWYFAEGMRKILLSSDIKRFDGNQSYGEKWPGHTPLKCIQMNKESFEFNFDFDFCMVKLGLGREVYLTKLGTSVSFRWAQSVGFGGIDFEMGGSFIALWWTLIYAACQGMDVSIQNDAGNVGPVHVGLKYHIVS